MDYSTQKAILLGKENILELIRKISLTCCENVSVIEVGLLFLLSVCSTNYNQLRITGTEIFHETIVKKCNWYLQKYIDGRSEIDCELLKNHTSFMFDSMQQNESSKSAQDDKTLQNDPACHLIAIFTYVNRITIFNGPLNEQENYMMEYLQKSEIFDRIMLCWWHVFEKKMTNDRYNRGIIRILGNIFYYLDDDEKAWNFIQKYHEIFFSGMSELFK